MILDHPIVNKYMFFPRSTTVEPSLFVEVEDGRIPCYLRLQRTGVGSSIP